MFLRNFIIHPLQALVGYVFFIFIQLLPWKAASNLGGWVGRSIGVRMKVTERARRNLAQAFPEKTPDEIEDVVVRMWDNLGRTLFEFPLLTRLRVYQENADVDVFGGEYVDVLGGDEKPGILFGGHIGNWEVQALVVSKCDFAVHYFFRAPNNPYIERLFRKRPEGKGGLLPKGAQGAKQALQVLKDGGHLGMLVDQKMNDGITVPFFGRDAMTAPALAQFALKYDCPIVPMRCERLEGTRFKVTAYPPLEFTPTGDRQADVATIMAMVNDTLESWIRERPEQWLWLHNRWPR